MLYATAWRTVGTYREDQRGDSTMPFHVETSLRRRWFVGGRTSNLVTSCVYAAQGSSSQRHGLKCGEGISGEHESRMGPIYAFRILIGQLLFDPLLCT